MKGPLEGIKVLELATHVAVPAAARCMADWGAEVIKVETLTGDLWRIYGPTIRTPMKDDENPIFCIPNSNKKIISVDMKSEEGKKIILKLMSESDIVLSNIRLKSLQKLGLDYDSVKEMFPKLVYLHFTAYGYEGDLKDAPGFDIAAFWSAGGMYGDWIPKNNEFPAMFPASSSGDMICSQSVLSGALAGLLHQKMTGEGCFLTTSLYANALYVNYADVISTQPQYGLRRPSGYGPTGNPLLCGYECKDGRWVYIACLEFGRTFERAFTALGLPEAIDEIKNATKENFIAVRKSWWPKIQAVMKTKTSDEWIKIFHDVDIVVNKVVKAEELYQSEQAWANGYLEKVTYPTGTETVLPNSPVHFRGMETGKSCHVPGVGTDTRAVLKGLGYSDEEIDALNEMHAINAK